MIEEQKYLRATVGAFIENKEGKILLIRSPKWQGLWLCPSGGIEYGESPVEAAVREAKEETGLDIKDPEFIQVVSMVEPKEYYKPMHFVGIDYKFNLLSENQELQLDTKEVLEAGWFEPAEIVKRDDVEFTTKESIQKILEMRETKKHKHSFFHHECNNCEKYQKETEEYKTGWQRARADYQNLQKEVEQMRGEWARMSEQQILEEFIPVYDNFKLAFRLQTSDFSSEQQKWANGIVFIMKQFWKVMQDYDVEEIKTVGEIFNPELHEAVSEEESDLPEHTIVKEVEAGYMMRGKVIKVAKVIVAK